MRMTGPTNFPNLSAAARAIRAESALIDGEVVIFDRDGRSNFQKLQHAIHSIAKTNFCFQAFDLIYLNGLDLTQVALEDRKRLLKSLFDSIPSSSPLRYSDHIEGNGDLFLQRACQTGVEGIVSKLRNSPYDSKRSRSWLKVKCNKQQDFVIVGYTDSEKGLPGFGALILGVYERNRLVYAGRVGTGFSLKQRAEIRLRLDPLSCETSALALIPKDPGLREAHWIEPKLVAEVTFIEWTSDGSIRHPSFQGLREDRKAKEVRREPN
jgi:bifunctional non-homologous end joining protein LigD